jgi:glycosyltransferase involved in cell wall biosynthesis
MTASGTNTPDTTAPATDGPLVSVVTPFFNTADYLDECIQSVRGQTYANWEYILADNCSTDDSACIVEKHAASDKRIRVVREVEFLGQTENYNRALTYISPGSRYCKIVQADDWIYPRCLEEMVEVAQSGQNVGLLSSFSLYRDCAAHGGLPLRRGPVYPGRDAARAFLLEGKALFGSPTCVMYLSDTVRSRKPFFSTTTRYFEDTEVCLDILRDHEFGFVPQVLSFSRRDNDSIWSRLERHSPYILSEVMLLHLFGRYFLDQEEFALRQRRLEDVYYGVLAQGAVRGYGKDFWDFHVQGLASVGQKISYGKVLSRVLPILAHSLLKPHQGVRALWRRCFGAADWRKAESDEG